MLRHAFTAALLLSLGVVSTGDAMRKSPPWIAVEAPVNPYDATTRDAAFLVRAMVREGQSDVADLSGSAEGIVGGQRQSVALHFEPTSRPDIYAVRRQWPAEGTWLVRVTLLRSTTALVSLDRAGNVVGARIPTQPGSGVQLPRPVAAREIDALLQEAAARR